MLTVALLAAFTLLCVLLSADGTWDNETRSERNTLVFDGRNRAYGAFVLRREYDRRFVLAFAGALSLLAGAVALPKVLAHMGLFTASGPAFRPETGIDIDLDDTVLVTKKPEPPKPTESKPLVPPIPSKPADPDVPVVATDTVVEPAPKDTVGDPGPKDPGPTSGTPGPGPGPDPNAGKGAGSDLGTPANPLTEAELAKVPRFPGGYEAMVRFIQNNIRFPEMSDGTRQKEWVEFVVDVNGEVVRVRAKGRAGRAFSEAAEKVVRIMPRWEAGERKDGSKAACLLVLPIDFQTR